MNTKEKKRFSQGRQELGRLGSMRKCGALRKGKGMLERKIQVGGPWASQAGEVGWTRAWSTCPLRPRELGATHKL